MKRRVSICGGIALLTCLLASCGSNSNPSTGEKCGKYEELVNYVDTGSLEFDSAGNVVLNDVNVTLKSICAGKDSTGLGKMVAKFNKEYEGKINVTFTTEGEGSFDSLMTTEIYTKKNYSTLYMFHNENIPTHQLEHYFQPLDRIYDMAKVKLDLSKYNSYSTALCHVGEHLYGVPVDAHSEVLIYRPDLLQSYGLSVPTSWDELYNAAYTIQNGEKASNPSFMGISSSTEEFGMFQYTFLTAIAQNGGSFLDKNYWPNWNKEGNIDAYRNALNLFKKMYSGNSAVSKNNLKTGQPNADFAGGNCAFAFVYTWELDDIIRNFESVTGGEWDIMPLSGVLNNNKSTAYTNKIYGISHAFAMPYLIEDVEVKAAACIFAKWYTENALEWAQVGHVPMQSDFANSEEYLNDEICQERTHKFGKSENFINFDYSYYSSTVFGYLPQLFQAVIKNPNVDIDATINKITNDAILALQSILED